MPARDGTQVNRVSFRGSPPSLLMSSSGRPVDSRPLGGDPVPGPACERKTTLFLGLLHRPFFRAPTRYHNARALCLSQRIAAVIIQDFPRASTLNNALALFVRQGHSRHCNVFRDLVPQSPSHITASAEPCLFAGTRRRVARSLRCLIESITGTGPTMAWPALC